MSSCEFFISKNYFKIITQSISEYGFGIATEPIFVLPLDTSVDIIADKIFECFSRSKSGVKFHTGKEEIDKFQKNILSQIQEKSFKDFYKNARGCIIERGDNFLYLKPYKLVNPARPNDGLIYEENSVQEFPINIDRIELTTHIINFLNE